MNLRTSLLGGGAVAALLLFAAGSAEAKTAKHHHPVHRAESATAAETAALRSEVDELRQQVGALKAWQDAQAANQQQSEAQLAQVKAQLADAQARADAAQAKVDAQIETIPGVVHHEVLAAAPKDDVLHFGVDPDTGKSAFSLKFDGFLAAETVYRNHQEGADIGSTFSGIPLPNVATSHLMENRFTGRQSRFSILAQGEVPQYGLHLTGYYEMDFLGAAQSANSNESNSYNPRIRNLYTTIDWDRDFGGLSLLAGQSWSLATMYSKGLSPRSEQVPLTIEAQYVVGFNWARQPGIRLTANINKQLWFAVSVENPQTTTYSSGKFISAVSPVPTITIPGGSEFNSANNLSVNDVPDVIGKVAFDQNIQGHAIHLEGMGIYRDFYDRLNYAGAPYNGHVAGGGFGGGIILGVVPKVLDLQFSGLVGRGIGRYGSGQLPDVSFGVDGQVHPTEEAEYMAGGILHFGKAFDFYTYAGEERQRAQNYASGTIYNGIGNPNYSNLGCETEGSTVCVGNTHFIEQITAGFWDRPVSLRFGKFQWGIQYSYTERHTFPGYGTTAGVPGNPAPIARENMVFTSIRYYPF